MTELEKLLIKYWLWVSGENKTESLEDSLMNRSKKSLTFKQAVEAVNELWKLVIKLENDNKKLEDLYTKNIQTSWILLGKYWKAIEELQEKKKELCRKLHDLKNN